MLTPQPERIVERAGELATLSELVETAHSGSGRSGVIVGDAGIGKTTLVGEVRLAAELRGLEVLQARGGELEHEFSYGIVRQLFESRLATATFDERQAILAGSAAIADQLFAAGASPIEMGPVDTSFALLHGLYWLTANLASDRPLLVLVDDLQWADEPSLRWLGYLVRRLEGLPVLVVVALRPPEQGMKTCSTARRRGRCARRRSSSWVRRSVRPGPGGRISSCWRGSSSRARCVRPCSSRERRIAARVAEGFSVDEIAQSLFLTPATVEDYLAHARRTLGVETNDELARAVASPEGEATDARVPSTAG